MLYSKGDSKVMKISIYKCVYTSEYTFRTLSLHNVFITVSNAANINLPYPKVQIFSIIYSNSDMFKNI